MSKPTTTTTVNFQSLIKGVECQHTVRVVTIVGKPWFSAVDVAHVLGIQNSRKAVMMLDADEKRNIDLHLPGSAPTFVSEAGLNRLVMRSDKPAAKPFQDWVCRVILPAIRKDGMYVAGEEKLATGEMSDDELTLMVMERPVRGH